MEKRLVSSSPTPDPCELREPVLLVLWVVRDENPSAMLSKSHNFQSFAAGEKSTNTVRKHLESHAIARLDIPVYKVAAMNWI